MARRREEPLVDPRTDRRRTVSVRLAAAYLEVDVPKLRKLMREGQIAYVRLTPRDTRIEVAELVDYWDSCRVPRETHVSMSKSV